MAKTYSQAARQNAKRTMDRPQQDKPKTRDRGSFDISLMVIVSLLIIFGMLMLFSASYPKALSENGDSYYLIREQVGNLILGVAAMIVVMFFPYRNWRVFAWPAMLFALVCLVIVLGMEPLNGARRWIIIRFPFGAYTFQPGEIAKFAIILVFAFMLEGNRKKLSNFQQGVLPFLAILGATAGLMLIEPHLSGAILIVGIGIGMMFAGGVPTKWIILIIAVGLGLVWLIWVWRPDFLNHAFLRVETFLDLENADPDASRQTYQSLTAIGSGGIWGRGLGKSRQKYMYLPEMHNDYIFAILCEELGLVGAVGLILLYFMLLVRCLAIARKVKDPFGAMLVVGVAVQITLQALLHMAVNANAIPATGISLPFFSYGGTALILQLVEVGIVLSVSRQAELDSRTEEPDYTLDDELSLVRPPGAGGGR